MPPCLVLHFRETDGKMPFDVRAASLSSDGKPAREVTRRNESAIRRLERSGHALRRPLSAPLRDGVHELRVAVGQVNYRVLYFFAGPRVAVITHGCTKEHDVPPIEIDRAVRRRALYLADPLRHTAPRQYRNSAPHTVYEN